MCPAREQPNELVKTQDELKEMASELVAACQAAVSTARGPDYNRLISDAARATTKGRLLVHKLGSFGSIWEPAFEPGDNEHNDAHRMLGAAQELMDAVTKGRLVSIEERV